MSSLSTFVAPNYTPDIFEILYDLPPSQKINAARFQTLKLQASLSSEEQIELNNLTIALQSYIIDPDKWNKFAQALSSMEGLLLDFINLSDQGDWSNTTSYSKFHIVEYLGQTFMSKQNTNQGNIPIGGSSDLWFTLIAKKGVSFNWRNAWDVDSTYLVNDGVFYGGSSYVCILNAPTGTLPTNTTYFSKVAQKGDQGIQGSAGLNLLYQQAYNSGTSYSIADAVSFNNSIYYCINPTSGGIDPTDLGYWALFLSSSAIPISASAPLGPSANQLWVNSTTKIISYWNSGTSTWISLTASAITDGTYTFTASNINDMQTEIANNSQEISVLSLDYNVVSSDIDANGIFQQVQYLNGSTLYMQSNLSGGISPAYTSDTWNYYQSDGVTVSSTLVWTLGYDANGNLISRTHS